MTSEKRRNERVKSILVIALTLTIFFAIVVVVYSLGFMEFQHDVDDASASLKFKPVIGKVLISHVRVIQRKATYHVPSIYYDYTVAGKLYFNDQIMFPNPEIFSPEEAAAFVHRYQVEHSVQVFYDPANPQKSCLIRGISNELKSDEFYKQH